MFSDEACYANNTIRLVKWGKIKMGDKIAIFRSIFDERSKDQTGGFLFDLQWSHL